MDSRRDMIELKPGTSSVDSWALGYAVTIDTVSTVDGFDQRAHLLGWLFGDIGRANGRGQFNRPRNLIRQDVRCCLDDGRRIILQL